MGFASVEEIETRAKEQECQLWETILHDDMTERQVDRLESIGKMSSMYLAMKDANESYDKDLKSQSGLSGGDGKKMMEEVRKMQNLTGEFVGTVMANALKMGESNACMKRIVAAPTAGACGVLPAVLITYEQFHKVPEAKMLEGMYIAAGVGQVIAERACIAGAQGGCQAEIGSASCMAAAAITYIRGGSTKQIFDAGAFALKSLLGLVCDPLGGLVEVPCIKRNVIGSVNAITASDMAMAGIESKVPLDEVIDAMAEVGRVLRRKYLPQLHLNLDRILQVIHKPQPVRDTDAVRIDDRGAGHLEHIAENQICRFPADPGQRGQLLHSPRQLAAVFLEQNVCAGDDVPRLRAVESAGVDVSLDLLDVRGGEGLKRRELLIERRRDHVHARVGALGGKAHGEQKLVVLFIFERAARVGVEDLQLLHDAVDGGFGFHGETSCVSSILPTV